MKAVKARVTRGLQIGSVINACDNSGAKLLRIVNIRKIKTVHRRVASAGVGDLIQASVISGVPDMRKQVVFAVIVRQRMPYRRLNGERIMFEDNAAVVLKDEKGNPKGTMMKGPIAKEVCDRWPLVAKIASIIV
jgi:large subunit ribosomal protein L14